MKERMNWESARLGRRATSSAGCTSAQAIQGQAHLDANFRKRLYQQRKKSRLLESHLYCTLHSARHGRLPNSNINSWKAGQGSDIHVNSPVLFRIVALPRQDRLAQEWYCTSCKSKCTGFLCVEASPEKPYFRWLNSKFFSKNAALARGASIQKNPV